MSGLSYEPSFYSGSEGDRRDDLRPMVAGAGKDWSAWLFGGLLALLAVVLFVTLNARREERSAPAVAAAVESAGGPVGEEAVPAFPFPDIDAPRSKEEGAEEGAALDDSLPQLQAEAAAGADAPVPLQFAPAPEQRLVVKEQPSRLSESVQPSALAQPSAPPLESQMSSTPARRPQRVLVYDKGLAASSSGGGNASTAGEGTASASGKTPARTTAPASASRHINPTLTVTRGTIIPAVLETALNTNHAGQARAIVSRDVRGFDGKRVLIPRGSRLLGEYAAEVGDGQNRILVVWDRLQRPDGAVVMLESPSADGLGRTGIKGTVRPNFFERFAGALLNTTLDIGAMVAAGEIGGNGAVIIGLPNTVREAAPSRSNAPQRTVSVKQGAVISVFVARDLDFAPVEGGGR